MKLDRDRSGRFVSLAEFDKRLLIVERDALRRGLDEERALADELAAALDRAAQVMSDEDAAAIAEPLARAVGSALRHHRERRERDG